MISKFELPVFKLKKENILILCYMTAFSLRYFTYLNKNVTAIIWTMSGFLLLFDSMLRLKKREKFLYLLLFVDGIAVINGVLNGNKTYIDAFYIITVQAFGIQLFLLRDKWKVIHIISIAMYIFVVVKVLMFRWIDEIHEVELSMLIGKNSASIIMIFACAIDIIYKQKNNLKMSYWMYLLGIYISWLCDSNGGILGFIIFAIGIFVCTRRSGRISWKKVLILVSIGLIVIITQEYLPKIIDFLLDDNSRFALWKMYIKLNIGNFRNIFFGAPLYKNAILYRYFNIHNNFLNWHCFFGLIPTLFFCGMVGAEGIYYFKKKEWFFVVIWGVLLIRSLTDGTDYCFMALWTYMIFDVISKKRIEKKNGSLSNDNAIIPKGYDL